MDGAGHRRDSDRRPPMSGRGALVWPMSCPVCGQTYMLTNFMRRTRPGSSGGWEKTDVHVMACLRRAGRDPWGHAR